MKTFRIVLDHTQGSRIAAYPDFHLPQMRSWTELGFVRAETGQGALLAYKSGKQLEQRVVA